MTPSALLEKYNRAKHALSLAVSIDEVKDIRDKAEGLRIYAMQARDRALIDHATEIRLRAERRAGELLKEREKNQGAVPGKTGSKGRPVLDTRPTLSDLNINKTQSSRWQKLADIHEDVFEDLVARTKHKVSAKIDGAQQQQPKPKPKSKCKPSTKREIVATCISEVETIVRAAISRIDTEERLWLFDQLDRAVRMIMSEAAVRETHACASNGRADYTVPPDPGELDGDRWTETH